MNECVFIHRTYHIVPQGGLQFYLSEIGRQLVNHELMILKHDFFLYKQENNDLPAVIQGQYTLIYEEPRVCD